MPFDLKAMIADDPPKKPKCAHTKKRVPDSEHSCLSNLLAQIRREGEGGVSATKKQKTLEPKCKTTTKERFKKARWECVKDVIDRTTFEKLTEEQEVGELLEINQQKVFESMTEKQKTTFFKEESSGSFRMLAKEFITFSELRLKCQFKDEQYSLTEAMENEDLVAYVAAHFEQLVKHGLVDLDEAWRCPEGCDCIHKRYCDREEIDPETLEGDACCKPVCSFCHPQKEAFDLCEQHNTTKEKAKMEKVFADRAKHAKREDKLRAYAEMRKLCVENFKTKTQDPWYVGKIDKKALFRKLNIPENTKRQYTAAEARMGAVAYGPEQDMKTMIRFGVLPEKEVPTITFNRKKMNGTDVQAGVKDHLTEAENALNLDSPDLDNVDKLLDSAQDLLIAGKNILLNEDFVSLNKYMKTLETSVYNKRNPPKPGVVEEPSDDEKYGSGLEDDEEEEDGLEEHDLNLLDMIQDSDDE
jgi:hypothetical protein